MNLFQSFKQAAQLMAKDGKQYSEVHRSYGLNSVEWQLLTQDEMWSVDQRMQVRSILSEVVNASLTIGGLPATALPAQYVAAIIATFVSPVNLIVAATRAPETYDAVSASGLVEPVQIKAVTPQQMIALCMAYLGDSPLEPASPRVTMKEQVVKIRKDN